MIPLWSRTPGWVASGAALDMDFANGLYYPSALSSLLTTTRASTGYAATAAGGLTLFQANIARITDLGLLVEQVATNAILQSQTFDSATWVKTNATVTADATTAPDGTTTADKLIASAGSAQHYVAQGVNGLTASEGRVVTVYAKYAGVQYLAMYMSQGPVDAWFDLQGGTVSNITGSASITALGNGWYRCQIYNSAATGTGDTYELHTASIAGNFTHTGDGVNGIYLWGVQLERPTSFATSYIPTTTVAVTRAADNITLAGAAATAALAAKAAYFITNGVAGGTSPRFFQTTSTANAFFNSTTQASISDSLGNAANATIGSAGTYTGVVKTALGFDATSITARANGGTQATSAHAWDGTTGTIKLGNNSALTRALNGYIQRAAWGSVKGQFDGLTA